MEKTEIEILADQYDVLGSMIVKARLESNHYRRKCLNIYYAIYAVLSHNAECLKLLDRIFIEADKIEARCTKIYKHQDREMEQLCYDEVMIELIKATKK